jgi:hypothetical protein
MFRRYQAAAAASDGARACSLLFSLYAEAIPEDYGHVSSLPYAHGPTCAVVMSKIFKHEHRHFDTAFRVTGVRVRGNNAIALLGSPTLLASFLSMRRERGTWKVDAAFIQPMR